MITAQKKQVKVIRVSEFRKERACLNLYKAVAKYVRLNGGLMLVAGGVQIIQWPGDTDTNFTIGIKCTGRKPLYQKGGGE